MPDQNSSYRVKAGTFEFSFTSEELAAADIVQVEPGVYHILRDHHSAHARIISADVTGKKIRVDVEGETMDVDISDSLDLMLEKMGFGATSAKHIKEVKAPMPGLVMWIHVEEGQAYNEGEKVLILEAMKMENSILLHAPGRISKIHVVPGQAVDKGQVLVELE